MAVLGYIRNNYPLKMVEQIKLFSEYECEDIRVEVEDLTVDNELLKLIEDLEANDTLVVTSLLSFGKTIGKLSPIIERIQEKSVRLVLIQEQLTIKKESSFYQHFDVLNDLESNTRSSISKQGLERKRNEPGVVLGRPAISEKTIESIRYLYQQKYSLREISEKCDVSLGSVHKYVQKINRNDQQSKDEIKV